MRVSCDVVDREHGIRERMWALEHHHLGPSPLALCCVLGGTGSGHTASPSEPYCPLLSTTPSLLTVGSGCKDQRREWTCVKGCVGQLVHSRCSVWSILLFLEELRLPYCSQRNLLVDMEASLFTCLFFLQVFGAGCGDTVHEKQ